MLSLSDIFIKTEFIFGDVLRELSIFAEKAAKMGNTKIPA